MKDEINRSFDFLKTVLDQRKEQIQNRLEEAVVSYGPTEKIVYEKRDWTKENENMPELFKIYKGGIEYIEEQLTINEQIESVLKARNVPAGVKLYKLLQDDGAWSNPRNFSEEAMANSAKFSEDRVHIFPDFTENKGRLHLDGLGSIPQPYREQALRKIRQHADKIRNE